MVNSILKFDRIIVNPLINKVMYFDGLNVVREHNMNKFFFIPSGFVKTSEHFSERNKVKNLLSGMIFDIK